jgi:hypothetical protein
MLLSVQNSLACFLPGYIRHIGLRKKLHRHNSIIANRQSIQHRERRIACLSTTIGVFPAVLLRSLAAHLSMQWSCYKRWNEGFLKMPAECTLERLGVRYWRRGGDAEHSTEVEIDRERRAVCQQPLVRARAKSNAFSAYLLSNKHRSSIFCSSSMLLQLLHQCVPCGGWDHRECKATKRSMRGRNCRGNKNRKESQDISGIKPHFLLNQIMYACMHVHPNSIL